MAPAGGAFGPNLYAVWRGSSLGEITDALEHRLLLEMTGPVAGRRVLDMGCGDGTLLSLFRAGGAAMVAGCDTDPRMVARARATLGPGAALAVARGQALPFPDGAFEVVTCITVLAFVPDATTVVREMARVLRPGGVLVIGDLGRWSIWALRRRIRGWLGHPIWRSAHFRSAGDLAALATRVGLVVTAVRGSIFYPPWTWAARRMASYDTVLGRLTTMGAAFVTVQAVRATDRR